MYIRSHFVYIVIIVLICKCYSHIHDLLVFYIIVPNCSHILYAFNKGLFKKNYFIVIQFYDCKRKVKESIIINY